jgi:hypothetical protein
MFYDVIKGGLMACFPMEGPGRRYLWCRKYDRCLDLAIDNGWRSFNCDRCTSPDLGRLSSIGPVLIPDYSDKDFLFEEDWEPVVCWGSFGLPCNSDNAGIDPLKPQQNLTGGHYE